MSLSSREYIIQQLSKLNPRRQNTKRILEIGSAALDIVDVVDAVAAHAMDDPHLNDAGKKERRHNALFDMFVTNEQGRQDVESLRAQNRSNFEQLGLPKRDKSDLVGEMRDAEARAIVRSMSQEKRDVLSNLPAALASAVIRVPPEFSGISSAVHKQVHSEFVEAMHPEETKALREEAEGLDWAKEALRHSTKALKKAANFSPGDEQAYMDRVRRKIEKPQTTAEVNPNDFDAWVAEHRRKYNLPQDRVA